MLIPERVLRKRTSIVAHSVQLVDCRALPRRHLVVARETPLRDPCEESIVEAIKSAHPKNQMARVAALITFQSRMPPLHRAEHFDQPVVQVPTFRETVTEPV